MGRKEIRRRHVGRRAPRKGRLVDLNAGPPLPEPPHRGRVALKDRRPFPWREVTGREDRRVLAPPRLGALRPEVAGLGRAMARPVVATLIGLSPARMACARPADAVIAEIRPPRAREHKELKEVGPELVGLAPSDVDPAPIRRRGRRSVPPRPCDAPATKRIRVPKEVGREERRRDAAQEGRGDGQDGAVRVLMAPRIGGVGRAIPPRAHDEAHVHGRAGPSYVAPRRAPVPS